MEKILQIGFSRVDITPDFPVGLSGFGDDELRLSEGVESPIYLTCIAVTSGEDTILLFDADLLNINDKGAAQICQLVCPATGIPEERVYCGATHTHSAPCLSDPRKSQLSYYPLLLQASVQAAQEALADRVPGQLFTVTKKLKNMNFVRHYLMADGSYWGSNFGSQATPHVAHAAESDPRMLLLKFAREGKQDIVLMNWQAHNDTASFVGRKLLSSSYAGWAREAFEASTGMFFAFFTGASGNQNLISKIQEENHGLDPIAYGKKLAEYAEEALQDMKPVAGTDIVTKRLIFQAPVNHTMDHMVKEATEVAQVLDTQGRAEAGALAKSYGFSSCYIVKSIISKSKMGETTPLVLNAFRIGDMGFITSPNELFSTIGLHVRLHGPFENTFIITGNRDYVPCMAAYEYGSYEAASTSFAKGTAEAMADTFVEMLEDICNP